jgi:glycosyltransferase involved in cell wall biosynthesis
MFKVDVITPVFNNVHYIKRCIESAHDLAEVNSLIIVDDGSTDGSFELVEQLQHAFKKIKLITHPARVNRGIARSRNLGIRHAETEWIAFLDSDDYYLPDRFKEVKNVIAKNPDVEGVYEPVVNKIVSKEGARRFGEVVSARLEGLMIRINKNIEPLTPFQAMYSGKGGVVHLNGLTLRKSLAVSVGLFDEELRIVDDSVFRLKVAYKGKLLPGKDITVAVRTIHDTNNEPNIAPYDNFKKFEKLMHYFISWGSDNKLKRNVIKRTLFNYLQYKKATGNVSKGILITGFLLKHPRILYHFFL